MKDSINGPVSISEASNITGLPESTIRYYDREFSDYLSIPRGDNNQRLFEQEHLEDLEYIRYLIKRENMSINEVRERLAKEMSFQEQSNLDKESVKESIPNLVDEDLVEDSPDEGERQDELVERLETLKKALGKINQQLGEMMARQEKIQKLLDLNLQRYNKLVDHLES